MVESERKKKQKESKDLKFLTSIEINILSPSFIYDYTEIKFNCKVYSVKKSQYN